MLALSTFGFPNVVIVSKHQRRKNFYAFFRTQLVNFFLDFSGCIHIVYIKYNVLVVYTRAKSKILIFHFELSMVDSFTVEYWLTYYDFAKEIKEYLHTSQKYSR